ncbi:MAG: 5'-methylthioadenosine/adenosylhomocysteine nucleosidase [Limnohabitans sp.]|jgi:adenosylhomocysteine nucleosidase|nr:5'-methylthioadenosine/adenosylhomocysteine nucleosidase [Burkholderiales bacterium]
MAHIALVGAMQEELAAVLACMPDAHCETVAGRDFWLGHWHGHEVVAVLSRIGKVAAASTATVLLERFSVQRVLFTGVAGGLARSMKVGDVVVATDLLQHDMNASPLFPQYEVPLTGRAFFATDPRMTQALVESAHAVLGQVRHAHEASPFLSLQSIQNFGLQHVQVHQGLVLSGDQFVASAAESRRLQQALPQALAVEMEGAALAQVCHDYGVPLAVLRTISDRADDDAHTDFTKFIQEVASRYSAAIVAEFLQRFT